MKITIDTSEVTVEYADDCIIRVKKGERWKTKRKLYGDWKTVTVPPVWASVLSFTVLQMTVESV